MKLILILALWCGGSFSTSCKPAREIQVERKVWILIAKDDAHRLLSGEYKKCVRLTWKTSRNILFYQYVSAYEAGLLDIGDTIVNLEQN